MLFRRYAPFIALGAAQLLVVLVAPSHPGTGTAAALGGTFNGTAPAAASAPGVTSAAQPGAGPGGAGALPGAHGGSVAAGSKTAGDRAGAAGPVANGQAGQGANAGGRTGGGTTSCITGLIEHPPCFPTWAGGDNGGTTTTGVTAKKITVVMYRNAANAAVDGILRSTGTYISPQNEQKMLDVAGSWINKHYQLYGRQIDWKYVVGSCDPAPPQDSCFRSDADNLVASYHPFAVFWDNDTNEAAFMDELSRKGVVNWGGWHFTDSFDNSLRPYHYDVFTGGDQQAQLAGEYYCNRLANKQARFAGSALQSQQRKVAVVYADTAVTTPSAKKLEAIIKGCDRNGVVDSPYSSDTTTASSQSTTQVSKNKNAGVTTYLWFCDVIAPAYGTKAQAAQNYFPEQVLAGSGLLDYDALAQTYDASEWAHAFGPSDLGQSAPVSQVDAGKIWQAEGQSGDPDPNSNLMVAYMTSLAGGVISAGAKLTPLSFEYGMLTTPGYDTWGQWHDPKLVYIKYGKGDYTGISDIREVYYDPNKTSPTNGQKGSYVPLNGGRRYLPGQMPSGEPDLPPGV